MTLTPSHLALIDALAELAVEEYLTAQAAEQQAPATSEPERALPPLHEAA